MKKGRKISTKKKDDNPSELFLSGDTLSDDEKIGETVTYYKQELQNTPDLPVVLDLCHLNKIYSNGIGVILGLYKECEQQKRPFKITGCSEDLYSLLTMFKLDKALSIEKVSQ